MNCCHQTFYYTEVIVDNLCQRCQAVCCAGCVGNDCHIFCICFVVYTHNEHRSVCGRSGNDNFFRATVEVSRCFIHCCEQTCGFQYVFSTSFFPRDVFGIHAVENCYFMTFNNQFAVFCFHFAVETTVCGIVFQHVHHVIQIDERIIYCNNLYIASFDRSTKYQTTNTTKSVNTNFYHIQFLLFFLFNDAAANLSRQCNRPLP